VRVLDGPCGESAILHLPVESLDVRRGKRLEPHAPNSGGYVALRLAAVRLVGAPPYAALYRILKPAVQILGHGQPRSVEDEALVRTGTGFPQRLARLLFGLARHVASLPVRAEVRASVGGYLPFLVLAWFDFPYGLYADGGRVASFAEGRTGYREWARRNGRLGDIHALDDRYDHDTDELMG
jgi:hypothetical protein